MPCAAERLCQLPKHGFVSGVPPVCEQPTGFWMRNRDQLRLRRIAPAQREELAVDHELELLDAHSTEQRTREAVVVTKKRSPSSAGQLRTGRTSAACRRRDRGPCRRATVVHPSV